MKNFGKQFLALLISLQLSGLPMTFAGVSQLSVEKFKDSLTKDFGKAENEGWVFLDSEKKEIHSIELVASVLKNRELYAVTPYNDEVGAKMTVHLQIENPETEKLSFRLSVLDKNKKDTLSTRKFVVELNASKAEATKLQLERTFRSMADEIVSKKAMLTQAGTLERTFSKIIGTLIPQAQAGGHENTATMLKTVAGGACTLGVILLLFSSTMENSNGKVRLSPMGWLTVVCFVLGGAFYIGSGLVADL